MAARLGTRPTRPLIVLATALALGVLFALDTALAAFAAPGEEESTAENGTGAATQVDPVAAGLAVVALLVALGLVFLLARRLFKPS